MTPVHRHPTTHSKKSKSPSSSTPVADVFLPADHVATAEQKNMDVLAAASHGAVGEGDTTARDVARNRFRYPRRGLSHRRGDETA